MKVIEYDDNFSVAGAADTNYPNSNVLDDIPQKKWRYTTATVGALTCTPVQSSALSTVSLHNIEAASVTITEWGESAQSLTIYTSPHTGQKSAWHEFVTVPAGTFLLTFTKDATTGRCGCGAIKYGARVEVNNLKYGMTEGYHDPSIVKEMSDGTLDVIRDRDKPRIFSGQMMTDRDATNYYNFMNNIARTLGYKPASWLITDISGTYWHVFARFASPVQSSHAYLDHSLVDIDIIEVL